MAVKFKKFQAKRNDKYNGKWYARAVHEGTIDLDGLADIMQDNCTVKRSDILAVLSELVETMRTQLQNSVKVKLDRFGTFKIGLNTKPADTAKDFTVNKNVIGTHVLFQPELKIDNKKNRRKAFLDGVKLVETTLYDKPDKTTDSGQDTEENNQ